MINKNFKIPLVIGITGHRDIKEIHLDKLKERVTEIYKKLIRKYPATPLVLLSPLADGADRIVVDVALEKEFEKNIIVSIPLPMDEQNYKATFGKGLKVVEANNEISISEYDKIIKEINERYEEQNNKYFPKIIPMLFNKELYEYLDTIDDSEIDDCYYNNNFKDIKKLPQTLEKVKNELENENLQRKKKNRDSITLSQYLKQQIRREQYSIVGEYIAIHSNILIALYDECAEEKPGGTKEIVRKKRTGKYEHFNILDEDVTYPEDGVIYSVATPKEDKSCTTDYEIKTLFPNDEEFIWSSNKKQKSNLYTENHSKINNFNIEVDKNINKITEKYNAEKLNECTEVEILFNKNIMMRRSAAFLSEKYQGYVDILENYILFLIAITTFFILVKSSSANFEYAASLEIIYVILIGLFYFLYKQFKSYKEQHEDYRALSEALRVQTAWNMVNINDSTSLYYLTHQKNELGWIRIALRGINIFYIPKEKDEKFDTKIIDSYWVQKQLKYFTNKIKVNKSKEIRINAKINRYFYAFIFFTSIFVILEFTTNIGTCSINFKGMTLVEMIKIATIGITFTMTTYLKSKQLFDGNEDTLREYQLSLDIFKKAKELTKDETKNKQNIYKNLGIEALRENSSWIITRRTKEYNTPT